MELFPEDIWADDALGRQYIAKDIEQLLSLGPGVVNVDAPYGHGKTFLLSRLAKQLARSGHHCVTIDTWSSDFHTDPVLVLFNEFTEQLAALGLAPGSSKLAESAKAVGKSLLRRGVPAAVKITTLGILDLKDIADEIEKGISDAAGEVTSDVVADYAATKKTVAEFRSALENAIGRSAEHGKQIVVIIDELDRCRPDYALRILEIVKHLFVVAGLTFVLGADVEALARAVNVSYGIGSDAAGYLGRLIDFTVKLPTNFRDAEHFAEHLVRVEGNTLTEPKAVTASFAACTRIWLPSLRDQVRAFRTIALTLRLKPDLGGPLADTIVALVCFKLYDSKLYGHYIDRDLSLDKLMSYFGRRAGVKSRSRAEIASLSHAFVDSGMASKIEVVAIIVALQMVDDGALRGALEMADWRSPVLTPGAVTPFGNFAPGLHSRILTKYREFQKLDHDLYSPGLRTYLDEKISIIG